MVFCKKKYEEIAQEEIDSVRAAFARKKPRSGVKEMMDAADRAKEKPDIRDYTKMVQGFGYAPTEDGEKEESVKNGKPHVISPEDFGEFEDYGRISLTLYSDGVLADENDEQIFDIEDTVGDAPDHFGEYEDDSVFVRNDERKCDYEILLDERAYTDVVRNRPGQVEV